MLCEDDIISKNDLSTDQIQYSDTHLCDKKYVGETVSDDLSGINIQIVLLTVVLTTITFAGGLLVLIGWRGLDSKIELALRQHTTKIDDSEKRKIKKEVLDELNRLNKNDDIVGKVSKD